MKRVIFMLCLAALITGCNNPEKENQLNKDRQYEADKIAANSKENISELPLNFEFGMTKEEVNNNLNKLLTDIIISLKYNNDYEYNYVLNSGQTIPTEIRFGFYRDSLYALAFSFRESPLYPGFKIDQNLIAAIDKDISSKVDTTYNRISYYEKWERGRCVYTKWYKGNQYIFLRHSIFSDIQYINAPVYRKVTDEENNKILDKVQKKAGVKVENSSIDGSVSQVKRYLKNNLKDPNSYESIEWSNVVETDNGYTVRHKYRAKNSMGGYVVENQIFYLDFQGNVTSVSSY